MSLPTSTHPFLITGNDANQFKVANSLRFRASNSAYLSRTPTSAGSRTTWTFSCWIKRGLIGSGSTNYAIFGSSGAGTTECSIYFLSDDTIRFVQRNGAGVDWNLNTPRVFRDPSAWYHLVFVLNTTSATASSRASIYINGQLDNTSASYPSQNYTSTINNNIAHWIGSVDWGSTRAYYSDCYMAEVNFIDGQALTPSSFGYTDNLTNQWVPKQYTGTYGTNGFYLPFTNNTTATSENKVTYSEAFDDASWGKPAAPVAPTVTANAIAAPNGTTTADRINFSGSTTHPVYKDLSFTITNGSTVTTSMYVKNYIAGTYNLQCYINSPGYLDGYATFTFDSSGIMTSCVGTSSGGSGTVVAESYDVGNGWYRVVCRHTNNLGSSQASARISIGQNGISGTSGVYAWGAQMELSPTVGPYFATTSSAQSSTLQIGRDESSNKVAGWNNWSGSGISLTSGVTYDVMRDSPTGYDDGSNIYNRGNYCTMNPLTAIACTPAQGNLYVSTTNGFAIVFCSQTLPSTGKLYWEFTNTSASVLANQRVAVGFALASTTTPRGSGSNYFGGVSGDVSYLGFNGSINGVVYATWTTNDVIGIAIDCFTGNYWFAVNNSWQNSGNPSAGTGYIGTLSAASTLFCPVIGNIANANGYDMTGHFNFGQRPFSYTPPTGFKALNSFNLPNPSLPLV